MTLLLHPGFHKTATSWLQETVFAERRLFRSLMNHHQIDELLVRPHDLDFDPQAAAQEIADRRANPRPGVVDVISSEILSGNIIMGSRDSYALADRLAASTGPAKVLLTIRAQKPITKSIYLQYVKRGGRLDIEEFLTFEPEPGYFWFDPSTLEFDKLAKVYANHFGSENVLVLPQELLVRDRPRYLRLLMAFAGLEESKAEQDLAALSARSISPPVSGIPILRLANSISQSPFNPRPPSRLSWFGSLIERAGYRWTFGEGRAAARISQAIEANLTRRYGASNHRLQQYCPVDLRALGYEVEEQPR
ncbi:MAG: hypothetical protein V2I43_06190 [Parvularcula sp.]|jgi:hypothetical protein|nr:hypothetical protein [Parvularcula sp.]